MEIKISPLVVGVFSENCYLVYHEQSRDAVLIDTGAEDSKILELVNRTDVTPGALLITHGHIDHIGAAGDVSKALNIPIYLHREDLHIYHSAPDHGKLYGLSLPAPPEPDHLLEDGEELSFGELKLRVIHTPGHTPGHVIFVADGHAFVGDCLFAGSIGRTDLPGGSYDTLMKSLREKIMTLPDETIVHSGHGPDTTIERERATNPFLQEM